jgi:PAS domain S-box-containing protein
MNASEDSAAERTGLRPDFREIAENIPHTVWMTDHQGHNYYQNGAWYDYVGAGPESSAGEEWLQFYHPDDRDHLVQEWTRARATAGEHVYDIRVRIRRWDGEYQWFRVQGLPVRDVHGTVVKWVGTCSSLKRIDIDSAAARRPLGLFEWNLGSGVVLHENDTLRAILGESQAFRGPWRQSPLVQAMHRFSREALGAALKAAIQTGAPLRLSVQLQAKDGPLRTLEVAGLVARDAAGRAARFMGTAMDAGIVQQPPVPTSVRSRLAGWQVDRVLSHMRRSLHEDIRLDELARLARLSPFHFARAFKQSAGEPPITYFQTLRVERARELLLGSSRSVQEIALAVGYGSAHALTRAFRNRFGTTPGRCRRESATVQASAVPTPPLAEQPSPARPSR